MNVVANIIQKIAQETGPCCCKNFLYNSIETSCELLNKHLKIELDSSGLTICEDNLRHPHGCRKEKCSFYRAL